MELQVDIRDAQTALPIEHGQLRALVAAVLEGEGVVVDEVAIHLVGLPEICQLHERYFGDPSPTDTISFPISDEGCSEYRSLGDVFVCPDVAVQYASSRGEDPYLEATLYIVHGLLHLLGYDDQDPTETYRMRSAEREQMNRLQDRGLALCASMAVKSGER